MSMLCHACVMGFASLSMTERTADMTIADPHGNAFASLHANACMALCCWSGAKWTDILLIIAE